MKALAYSRVSTDDQARHGISLEMQASRIAAYCAAQGWDMGEIYSDEGISGARRDRPALLRLLRDVEAGEAQVVVTWKFDRVARNALYFLEIVERLHKHNVRFVSVTESFDTGTSHGKLVVTFLAGFAEHERAQISERITAAMLQKTLKGEWVGRVPFGYRMEDKRLLPDPALAPLVGLAFRLLADDHLSLAQIARRLTAATGAGPSYGRWSASDVQRMIRRPVYVGSIKWNGQIFPGNHEPLVERDLWDRAQEVMKARALRHRETPSQYLLSGLLRCPKCGWRMTGQANRSLREGKAYAAFNYACGNQDCHRFYISKRKAEAAVIQLLGVLSRAPGRQIQELPRAVPEPDSTEAAKRELAQVPQRESRQIEMLERGLITESEYRRARERLLNQKRELESLLLSPSVKEAPAAQMRRRFRDLAELLQSPEISIQHKKDMLGALIARIDWSPSRLPLLTLRPPKPGV